MSNVYRNPTANGLQYGDYTIRLSQETRSFFPSASELVERGEIVIKAIYVTREMAEAILAGHNNFNRPEKPGAQKKYTKSLNDGTWYMTHQGLAFGIVENSDGEMVHELFDGQNRLRALVNSDQGGATFLVFFGFQNNFQLMNSIDSGKTRDQADALTILIRAGKLRLSDGSEAVSKTRNAAALLKSMWHGTSTCTYQLPKADLQGLAIAAKKVLNSAEKWRDACRNIDRSEVFGMCARAYYAYENAEPRIKEFLKIVDNEMEFPAPSASPKDRWAYVFRAWYKYALPRKLDADKVLNSVKGIGRDGQARSVLSRVAELCLVNFLEENPSYRGFRSYATTGNEKKLRFSDLEADREEELLPFPEGIKRLMKSETEKLLRESVKYTLA